MPDNEQAPLLQRADEPGIPTVPKEAQRDIQILERQFAEAEIKTLRESEPRLRPLYARRQELVKSKLENHDFWPRVFAAAPADIDNSILSSDAEIIGTCLKNVNVERFELNDKGEGEPRSVRITFEFNQNPENIWIEDEKVVKTFYWRKQVTRTKKGKYQFWEGLISEPVRIHWKKDHDPTKGLLDAACNLFDAEKKAVAESGKKLTGEERTKLAEYEKLVSQVEKMELEAEKADGEDADDDIPDSTSFFAFFGYRGPDVAAEESAAAAKEDDERFAKVLKGETLDDEPDDEDDEDEDDEDGLEEAEIFPDGESLATDFADDLFPNALQYYLDSFEAADDFEDDEGDDLDAMEDETDENEKDHPRKKAKTDQ